MVKETVQIIAWRKMSRLRNTETFLSILMTEIVSRPVCIVNKRKVFVLLFSVCYNEAVFANVFFSVL